jgi:large subunit ribosomal protein L9
MKQQLLLLQDVDSLGKKGELVTARRGYMRNFLIPQGLAIVATTNTLKKQERLRVEREKQAVVDRKESDEIADKITRITLEIRVKVDPEGHMYGSVSASDIVTLLATQGIELDRKHVLLTKPLKVTGQHKISFKLKEAILATCMLRIIPEGMSMEGIEAVTAPIPTEEPQSQEESPS